jgi:hypothetical protein
VRAEDIPNMAIITPFGLWEFLLMPFRLKNTVQSFQRLMDRLMAGLDFVFVYLDNIPVTARILGYNEFDFFLEIEE